MKLKIFLLISMLPAIAFGQGYQKYKLQKAAVSTQIKITRIFFRWFQWGAFNPIFRIHGYQTETEPWKYGDTVENNMQSMMNLRYRLMPYIYSEAWQISKKGSTIMRLIGLTCFENTNG